MHAPKLRLPSGLDEHTVTVYDADTPIKAVPRRSITDLNRTRPNTRSPLTFSREAIERCYRLPAELVVGLVPVLQNASLHQRMQHVAKRLTERIVRPEHPLDLQNVRSVNKPTVRPSSY
ncbi:cyanophycinase-like exopeptidase [Micromonospora luteifusca]|uniref:Cyanophycinase-like exopeptidase n=1 Tax=Micromonospora luteifusca TaxID=709860 RepID=A0ABS2M3C5_9ACTN|nr:hypothetical protein [Micromonospora luteifusca]MBM7494954.1 cyanophycinase-like exopeptidase [Micromonospora luteifusca]